MWSRKSEMISHGGPNGQPAAVDEQWQRAIKMRGGQIRERLVSRIIFCTLCLAHRLISRTLQYSLSSMDAVEVT